MIGSRRITSELLKTEKPETFSETCFRFEVEAYRDPFVSFPRFDVLLDNTDLALFVGLILLRRSMFGVLDEAIKFRLVLERDSEPMNEFL